MAGLPLIRTSCKQSQVVKKNVKRILILLLKCFNLYLPVLWIYPNPLRQTSRIPWLIFQKNVDMMETFWELKTLLLKSISWSRFESIFSEMTNLFTLSWRPFRATSLSVSWAARNIYVEGKIDNSFSFYSGDGAEVILTLTQLILSSLRK